MVAKTFDKSAFLARFKEETEDHLRNLNKGLLTLEKEPTNKSVIEELFREAHTLKGSATMMGFDNISGIAHAIEDIFDRLRNQQITFGGEVADVIFSALDSIEKILEETLKGKELTVDATEIIERLKKFSSPQQEISPIQKTQISEIEQKEKISPEEKTSVKIEETIRVGIEKLDNLINLVGELVISKIRLDHRLQELKNFAENLTLLGEKISRIKERLEEEEFSLNVPFLIGALKEVIEIEEKFKEEFIELVERFNEANVKIGLTTNYLQDSIMKVRMLPLSTIFSAYPRTIRDLARQEGKEIEIEIYGSDTELDKSVIDQISEPLIHIIRNVVDHGIELPYERERLGKRRAGKVILSAYHQGDQVVISIEDDGRGIDKEIIKKKAIEQGLVSEEEIETYTDQDIINLIFMPGFSTKSKVTSVSGRGVGLDAVKEVVQRLKGTIEVKTKVKEGTAFILTLPLTLAITEALLISSGGENFAIPLFSLEETIQITPDDIKTIETKEAIQLRDKVIPVIRLSDVLGLPSKIYKQNEKIPVVIVSAAGERCGIIIEKLLSKQEIVIKSLGNLLKKVKCVAGATILGSGEIVLILDIPEIIQQGKSVKKEKIVSAKVEELRKEEEKVNLLFVEDSLTAREIGKSILEANGYDVEVAVDGMEALEKLKKAKFDLVITDIEMPRLDGFSLIEKMKQDDEYKNIPVIIVTTREKEEDKRRGMEVGADAYIVKSQFNQEELLNCIKRLVR